MKLPTGSSLDLAAACAHPFTSGLSWAAWQPSPAADFGTAVHAAAEAMALGKLTPIPASLSAPERRRFLACAWHVSDRLARLHADGWICWPEVPLAYDVERGTARLVKSTGPRDYSDRRPGEIACTLDLVRIRPGRDGGRDGGRGGRDGGEVEIDDYKTGRPISHGDDSTWQMRLAALAVTRMLGATSARVALVYLDEDGIREDTATIDAWALDCAADELRAIWRRVHAGPQPPTPGAHCTTHYCRLVGQCSATRAALVEVRDDGLLARLHEPGAAARALALLPQAEAALEAVRAELRAMASREPIAVAPGRVWGAIEQTRESIDLAAPGATDVLRASLGDRVGEALDLSTSKAAIERVAGRKGARAVIDALRGVGAVRTSTYTRYQEFATSTGAACAGAVAAARTGTTAATTTTATATRTTATEDGR